MGVSLRNYNSVRTGATRNRLINIILLTVLLLLLACVIWWSFECSYPARTYPVKTPPFCQENTQANSGYAAQVPMAHKSSWAPGY